MPSRIEGTVGTVPVLRVGLGGHHYVICRLLGPVQEIACRIGRSPRSVYYRRRYGVWALRIRDPVHKQRVRSLFTAPASGHQEAGGERHDYPFGDAPGGAGQGG